MAPPITVERAEQSLAFDHRSQALHHRPGGFLLHQLRVVDLAGGVIQNHDQVVPALITEPLVFAAIDVQQHAWHRPPFSSPPVLAPLSSARHQSRSLQRLLHEGVAQLDAVFFAKLFVEMPHVQIEVGVPVQTQNLLHFCHWHPPGRWACLCAGPPTPNNRAPPAVPANASSCDPSPR
jgi:hypothetical protein